MSSNIVELIEDVVSAAVSSGVDCVERSPGFYGPSKEAEEALTEAKWRLLVAMRAALDEAAMETEALRKQVRHCEMAHVECESCGRSHCECEDYQ